MFRGSKAISQKKKKRFFPKFSKEKYEDFGYLWKLKMI